MRDWREEEKKRRIAVLHAKEDLRLARLRVKFCERALQWAKSALERASKRVKK